MKGEEKTEEEVEEGKKRSNMEKAWIIGV